MSAKSTEPAAGGASEREMLVTRVFDCPRELMFKAWTDPAHLVHWWGPKGFTNTFHEFDLRVGGRWRFTMHGPDGVDYPNDSEFIEITPPSRLVFRHLVAPFFLVTATFEDLGGRTKLTWSMLFDTKAEYDRVSKFAIEGQRQNLDKLAVHLESMS